MSLLQLDTSLTSTKHKVMTRIRRLGLSKSTDITWRHQPFFDPLLVSKGEKGSFGRSIQSTHTWEVIEGIRDLTMVLPVITNATDPQTGCVQAISRANVPKGNRQGCWSIVGQAAYTAGRTSIHSMNTESMADVYGGNYGKIRLLIY